MSNDYESTRKQSPWLPLSSSSRVIKRVSFDKYMVIAKVIWTFLQVRRLITWIFSSRNVSEVVINVLELRTKQVLNTSYCDNRQVL